MFKTLRVLAAFFYIAIFALVMPSSPASAVIAEQPCNQFSWTGEDDTAHQMSLPYNLPLGDTTYSTTYVTTNGTLTFGSPDANYSSYPNTPSISLAGYDWVTFGQGTSLSYGVTDTGFCVEWIVRPYPQSSGDLTTIKLTVDTSRLPTWSGIVETTGWLPADLRRGIRFQSGEEVVQISEAFTINGGLPVEMQTCWDETIIPMSGTCPAEPPPGQCWDGSTVAYNQTCPPVPPDTQCWDGTWVAWSQTCPTEPTPTPTPTPEPTQSQLPEPTPEPIPTPIEPTPMPTEPVLTPEPILIPTPIEIPDLPIPEELLPITTPENLEPSFEPTPELIIELEPIIEPELYTEFTQEEVNTFVEDAISDGLFTEAETEAFIENLEADGEISAEEVSNLFESLTENGVLTQEDKELLSDVLVAQADGEAITSDLIEELGLDYEDLPPEQPVALDNGVILTAEIADAIEIFEDPSELLTAVFTDPGKALKAIANVGADMTVTTRKEAQEVTVAAVIVTQVIAGTSALSLARK